MEVAEHTFLVAGGGSGLGAATARLLADEGANVVVADLRGDDAGGASGSSRPTSPTRRASGTP